MNSTSTSARGPAVQSGPIPSTPVSPYRGSVPGATRPPASGAPAVPPSTPRDLDEPPPINSNAAFLEAIFHSLPEGAVAAICSKRGDPGRGAWPAMAAGPVDAQCPPTRNNYINASSFRLDEDGRVKARKERFAGLHFVLLDDLATKVPFDRLAGFEPTWLLESSPGNHQGGIVLDPPITDRGEAERLLNALIGKGLCDPGAGGVARWARLPRGVNGKPKHRGKDGAPFACRLVHWNPQRRYSVRQLAVAFALDLAPADRPGARMQAAAIAAQAADGGDDVFSPRPAENPVVAALKARGLHKQLIELGKHDVTCPWVGEHTDAVDHGTAYWEPDDGHPLGGFRCLHSHGDRYRIRQLLEFLGVAEEDARHENVIRVRPGALHRVVRAAEIVLAQQGKFYQAGGLIVTVSVDPSTGDPSIVPTTLQALTRELARSARWELHGARGNDYAVCDPPQRHVSILYDARHFERLPVLAGLARQPYFREDGSLVTQPGYDPASQRYGVFDPAQFPLPEPTAEAARAALELLLDLVSEFHFVSEADRSAALSAMFTAVTRPTLDHAPGYHVRAPVFASGKTLLCDVIGAFAGPGRNSKVSYPMTSEEATKVLLALLLTGPAVIEFDDMDSDWVPHGVIKRVLTAEKVTERILGFSKVATVSTRTLFLASGNNVGPVRDLLRRVATIHLDPRSATPATLEYRRNPAELVRRERGRYVAAVLTIILAWRAAGSPRPAAEHIATFGGAWSEFCRFPLMWLGLPDPATSLLHQVRHDPDGEGLGRLMKEWLGAFGSAVTPIRRAIRAAHEDHPDLLDALQELPVTERGEINRSKLGWFLRKHAGRIVDGLEFQRAEADGRTAWCVVPATKAGFAPPPPPPEPDAGDGDGADDFIDV